MSSSSRERWSLSSNQQRWIGELSVRSQDSGQCEEDDADAEFAEEDVANGNVYEDEEDDDAHEEEANDAYEEDVADGDEVYEEMAYEEDAEDEDVHEECDPMVRDFTESDYEDEEEPCHHHHHTIMMWFPCVVASSSSQWAGCRILSIPLYVMWKTCCASCCSDNTHSTLALGLINTVFECINWISSTCLFSSDISCHLV